LTLWSVTLDPMEDERQLPGYDSGLPEDRSSQEEETVAAEIEDLLRQGYSASQVVNEFGYARSSVNRVAKRCKKGKTVKGGNSKLPAALSPKQLIPPEIALQNIRLEDGRYKEGFIDGMSVLLMSARYNQVLAATQAESLKSQLDILKMAQTGVDATVREVANIFAGVSDRDKQEVIAAIQAQAQQQAIAKSDNPMLTMMQTTMANTMQPILQSILTNAFGGLVGQPPEQPPPEPGPFPQGPESIVEKHSIEELEEED